MRDENKTKKQLIQELQQLRRRIVPRDAPKSKEKRVEAPQQSEANFRALAENAHDGILIATGKGAYVYANKEAAQITGYSIAELLRLNIKDLTHPDEHSKITEKYRKRLAGKPVPRRYETAIFHKDGHSVPVEITAARTVWKGHPAGLALMRDITERKKTEETLQESEEKYRAIFDRSLHCVYVHDFEGRFLDANKAFLDLLGYRKKDIPALRVTSLLDENQLPEAERELEVIKQHGFSQKLATYKLRRKDGQYRWIQTEASLIYRKGKPYAVQRIARDISEQKRAEKVLLESEERFRLAFEDGPLGMALVGLDYRLLKVNKVFCQMLGYAEKELTALSFVDITHPEDVEKDVQLASRVFQGEIDSYNIEKRYLKKNGQILWGGLTATVIRDKDGNALYGLAMIEDITERKQAQAALRESEQKYRMLVEHSLQGFVILQEDPFRVVFANSAMAEIIGYTVEELLRLSPEEMWAHVPPEDRETLSQRHRDRLSGKPIPARSELRFIRADGSVRSVEMFAKPVEYGGKSSIQAVFVDITERKQAEELLRESEEQHRTLVEESLQGLVITQGFPPRILFANSKAADIIGFSTEEVIALTPEKMMDLVHVEDKVAFHGYLQDQDARESLPASFEFRIVRKDKIVRWVETYSTNMFYRGEPAVQTSIIDITERKQAEKELKDSQEYFRHLLQNSSDLVMVVEADGTLRYVSPTAEEMYGYTVTDLLETNVLDYVHPEDLPRIQSIFNEAIERPGPTATIECRVRREDGSWIHIESKGNNLLENPVVEGVIINSRDVTERKQAEDELRKYREHLEQLVEERTAELQEANEKLRGEIEERKRVEKALTDTKMRLEYLLSSSPAVLYTSKATGDYAATFISENVKMQLDYEPEDFLNNPEFWVKHIHPEDRQKVLGGLSDILQKGHLIHEYRFLHHNGTYRWMRDELKVTRDQAGRKEIIGYWIDITDRKEAEESLRQNEQTMRALLNAPTDSAWVLVDSRGIVLASNEAAAGRLGKKVDEFLGSLVFDHFPPGVADLRKRKFDQVFQTGAPVRFEDERAGRTLDSSMYPIYDAHGEVIQVAGFSRDVTEHKRAEEMLRESEEAKRALLNATTDSALLLDLEGNILALNEVAAERLGKSVHDLVGVSAQRLFSPDLFKNRQEHAREVIASGKPARYEDERDGRTYDTSVYPVFKRRKEVSQLAVYARDITERKELELRNRTKAELLDKLRDCKTAGECLQLGCQAIHDAGLFERAIMTLHDEKREITHCGHVGLDPKVVQRACKAPAPDENLTKQMTQKKFQISHSFFIPKEASLDFTKTGRHLPQKSRQAKKTPSWKPGDELFVPIISKGGPTEGYLSVDTPMNGERPKRNTILFLEDIVDIVARQIREIQNTTQLRQSEKKYRQLADLLPQTVFELDLKGNLTFSNLAGFESFGYRQKDLDRGLNAQQLFVPEDGKRIKLNIQRRLRGEDFIDHEYTALRRDKSTFPVLIYSSPIIHDKKPAGLRGIILDISELKRMEKELRDREELYRSLVETSPDGITLTDLDSTIAWCNKQTAKIHGFDDAEEIIGTSAFELIASEDHQRAQENAQLTLKQGFIKSIEYTMKKRDGTCFPGELSASLILDTKGNPKSFMALTRDVSERKRMEKVQELLQRIADAVHIAVDLNALFKAIHQELSSILNTQNFFIALYDKENDTISFPYHQDERDPYVETLPAESTLTGYVIKNDKPLLITAGGIEKMARSGDIKIHGAIPEIWLGVPLKARGEKIGALVVQNYTDRTTINERDREILEFVSGQVGLSIERKRAEDKLRTTLEELTRSNADLEQFAYIASHEMQEPLQAVAMSLAIVAQRHKARLDAEADKFLGYAVDESKRMQMLVEDLLTYSRVGKGGKQFEPTDCLVVLDQTCDNLLMPIECSGAKITNDPLPTVMGDPIQLTQLFQNLIDNAIKFRSKKPPRIHVSAKKKEGEWVFSVRDNGIGFDPKYVEKVFIIFERLLDKAEYPGTGIGLAISRKIVERHGGRIWAESRPGKGATFYFTIPAMKGTSR